MDVFGIRHKLTKERKAFLDDLRPEYIVPSLLDDKVVTPEEQGILSNIQLSRENRVEQLLDIMGKKDIQDLKCFLKALRIDKDGDSTYPWLAEILEKEDLDAAAYKTLVFGNVRNEVDNLLIREDKLNIIRTKLKQASDCKRHWVVLHGPIGSGKTVLAAKAIRNNDVVLNLFPGGVYWIEIDKLTEKRKLKEKMKRLIESMNCQSDLYQNESLDNLRFRLKKEIVNRESSILVVLDGVSSCDVISAFDIGCPIMVTTNDDRITIEVSSYCSPVDCPYDLTDKEVMNLLYMYVSMSPEDMPVTVKNGVFKEIVTKCGRSPLMTRLMGLCLADYGINFEMWKCFNTKLNAQGIGSVQSRDYGAPDHRDLKTLVHFAMEPIKKYKKYYQDFLIFNKVPVPHEMLQILWDKSSYDVMEIMNDLYHRCFVEKVTEEFGNYPSYIPHDLYLNNLKEEIENMDVWLQERHKKLIDQLHILPSGDIDLSSFPKNFIPYTIGYHLSEAREYNLLEKVYCNFRFIKQMLQMTQSPEELCRNYHLYKEHFENPEHVQKFVEFVMKNSDNIIKNKADIIQLALFEPTDSIVYQRAKEKASVLNSGNDYDWCNKEENINCKISDPGENLIINHAVFNLDGSLVATVGVILDSTTNMTPNIGFLDVPFAMIFSSLTGEKLMELDGHSKKIVHCAYNPKGGQFATASGEIIKIFEIDERYITSDSYAKKRLCSPYKDVIKKKEMFTFPHDHEVVCCEFSPDGLLIISGDVTGIIFVWEVNPSGDNFITKQRVKHGSPHDSLKYSCFSSDGTMFGACCNDTVKIWKLDEGDDPDQTFIYESSVVSFCFSKNDASVLAVLHNDVFESNIESGDIRSIHTYSSSAYVITSCCLSPDGSYFAYVTSSHSVIIINVHSQNIVAYIQDHNDVITNVMFSENGKRLLSVSSSRYIIHDLPSMKQVHFAKNLSVRFNEEITIASSNYFNSIEVRKGLEGKLVVSSGASEEYISACSLSYDCKEVVYGTINGCLKVFNLDSKIIDESLPMHEGCITYILHSKNKCTFFTCSEDKTIRIWKKSTDPLILNRHTEPVLMCAEFQTDKLLSCSKDGTMKIWNSVSGEFLQSIYVGDEDRPVGFLDTFASGDLASDETLKVFNSVNEDYESPTVRFCDISRRGDLLASVSSDQKLKVWSLINGQRITDFKEETDEYASVKCCRLLPGKNILAAGYDDGRVKLWHRYGKPPVEILPEPHNSAVQNILFRQDDSLKLLSLSNDIKLWHQNRLLQTIILPSSSMGFSPPDIWASDDFGVIVTTVNNILYILKRIQRKSIVSPS